MEVIELIKEQVRKKTEENSIFQKKLDKYNTV